MATTTTTKDAKEVLDDSSKDNDQNNDSNKNDNDKNKNRILFASCHSQHYKKNLMWPSMASRNASAFVWAGDAIYADQRINGKVIGSTPDRMKRLYEEMLTDNESEYYQGRGGYASFLKAHPDMEILGTWDDHDYGIDNGDVTYPYRIESAVMFVDFLERSNGHALNLMKQRARDGKGVYGVSVFDFATTTNNTTTTTSNRRRRVVLSNEEAGIDPSVAPRKEPLSDRSVAIFLLDVRSHKTPWIKEGPERYSPDYSGDFLGEEQWTWLQESLQRSTAAVNIIVSGLQVHADTFFEGNKVEDWSRYPLAQQRLYQLILSTPNLQAPILISGDVHMAQKMRRDCQAMDRTTGQPVAATSTTSNAENNRRMLLEITTSGITHSWGSQFSSRAGDNPSIKTRHLDRSLNIGMHVAQRSGAWKHLISDSAGSGSGSRSNVLSSPQKRSMQYSLKRNFAELEFDWTQRHVTIQILGEEVDGPPLLSTTWDFDTLSGHLPPPSSSSQQQEEPLLTNLHFRQAQSELQANVPESSPTMDWNLTVNPQDPVWICLPYRGPQTFGLKLFNFVVPAGTAIVLYFAPVALPVLFMVGKLIRWYRQRKVNVIVLNKKKKTIKTG